MLRNEIERMEAIAMEDELRDENELRMLLNGAFEHHDGAGELNGNPARMQEIIGKYKLFRAELHMSTLTRLHQLIRWCRGRWFRTVEHGKNFFGPNINAF